MSAFFKKSVDDKLTALYTKLCRIENALNKFSSEESGNKTITVDSGDDEDLPFK